MHLLVYNGQVSWRLNDKIFLQVGVLYTLKLIATDIGLCAAHEETEKNAKFWLKCHELSFFPHKLALQYVIGS